MVTAHLLGLANTACPTTDGPPPQAPNGPHAILYGGTPRPDDLCLTHRHTTTARTWQIVCVSNNPEGARTITDRITRAIDSIQHPDHPHDRYTVTYTSGPIEDRDDPTAWRWSSTVEIHLTTPR